MDKKGQVGMDTAKAVTIALMVIGVIAFTVIILLSNLSNTSIAQTSGIGTPIVNETVTTVIETGDDLAANINRRCAITSLVATNATSGTLIPASNYTLAGCNIRYNTGQGNALGLNNSNWNASYSFTFNQFDTTSTNVTGGLSSFFSNARTWFALLAIVVIILIIAIVIFAVNRFNGGNNSQSNSRQSSL